MLEQPLRFFHGLLFPECLPEDQEEEKKYERRHVDKGLKFVGESEDIVTCKEEDSAQDDPEDQRSCRVFAERSTIVFRFVLQKPELGEPFGDH